MILNEDFMKPINFAKYPKKYKKHQLLVLLFLVLLLLFLLNDYILVKYCKSYSSELFKLKSIYNNSVIENVNRNSSIDFDDEFFQIKEVQNQIYLKNLSNIKTLSGSGGNIGNALISLNNLINICINIKCKNIITPKGTLKYIIKKPIYNKEFNITILPSYYENITKIDIKLNYRSIFFFKYKNKINLMRLWMIKKEVLNNIPRYVANPNDLYIHIRSGDVFINCNASLYSQPPLCFYQKIINENKFQNIYIVANGHENPVVDQLLKLYPNIKYMHGALVDDITVIVHAYNFVTSISTFPMTLIWLNNYLKNLFIFDMMDFKYFETIHFNLQNVNYTIYKMIPSQKYYQMMDKKWERTREQLDLMLTENCTNTKLIRFN